MVKKKKLHCSVPNSSNILQVISNHFVGKSWYEGRTNEKNAHQILKFMAKHLKMLGFLFLFVCFF